MVKKKQAPIIHHQLVFERVDPELLKNFDMSTKRCAMNCGPHAQDPRSEKERVFLCEDCEPLTKEI